MTSGYLQRPLRSLEEYLAQRRAAKADLADRLARSAGRVADDSSAPHRRRAAAARPGPAEGASRLGTPAPG